jgi:uncharacterized protein YceH (UPF0502 family)
MEQTTEPSDEAQADEALLSPIEARVLGALMEKQRTTPDYYPLTLKALVQACNQKTSRQPVMKLSEGEVGHTVNQLRDRELVRAAFSGRAERYEQRLAKSLELDRQEQATLCALLLRGAQTQGELRINAARMAEFDDLAAMNDTLERLRARDIPLVKKLLRESGRREERYVHLLCGEPEQQPFTASERPTEGEDARQQVDLEREVRQLRVELDALWRLTGLEQERPDPE